MFNPREASKERAPLSQRLSGHLGDLYTRVRWCQTTIAEKESKRLSGQLRGVIG